MKKPICFSFLFCLCIIGVYAQQKLPVIHSHAKSITIRDGNHLKPGVWGLDPAAKPDIYLMDLPRSTNKVTFITDLDSISFNTQFGEYYDFVVLFNNKDSCFIRISAKYPDVNILTQVKPTMQADTIPFIMRNSRPYVAGKVNGGAECYIMLDLGAGITCVNINSVKKTGIRFDGKRTVINTSGTNEEPTSSNTVLQIGNLKWEKVPVVQVRNLADEDDMIIGNSLFADRVLEIDYDKKILIVHQQLAQTPQGYTRHAVQYDQNRPKIKIDLSIGGKTYSDWFLYDTGRDGTMLIGEDFTGEFDVWQHFNTIFTFGTKKIVVIPETKVGSLTFKEIVTNANDPAHPTGKQSLLGNELLSQFNTILDNRNGVMYLKANSLQRRPYEQWGTFRYTFYGVILGSIVTLGLILWGGFRLIRRMRRKKALK